MKNYTRLLSLAALFLLVGMFGGCKGKMTKHAVKKGEVFKASIEDFEKNRQKFSGQVSEAIGQANESLAEENPNTEKISKDFEKDWTDIQNRYNKMKKDFDDVGKSSTAYFDHLNELAMGINREDLRKKELGKNKELLVVWEKQYAEAAKSIEAVEQVLVEGNDFQRVLLLSSVRDKIQENINDLNELSSQAETLLKDLEAFTDAGRKLVKNEG